ncbi:MAG: PAS domain S-box protein [Bacteroidales bacterium]|nr:PAS domain S-box protein [Bacteroidales bacterium]
MPDPNPKQPEDKLRLIEFMVDHAAEGIYMIGRDGKILYANKSACEKLGYSREQLLQMDAFAIDPNFKQEKIKELWEKIRTQSVFTIESVQVTQRGMVIPTEVTINYLKYGEEELLVAFVKDISERKEEEHLKNISYTIFQSFNKSTSLNNLILNIRNELSKILDTTSLKIILRNTRTGQNDLFYAKGGSISVAPTNLQGTLAGWLFEKKKSTLLTDNDIRKLQEKGSIHAQNAIPTRWIGAPLFVGTEVMGIISLESWSADENFTNHHLEIMEFVCSQISLSIQRRQSEEALRVSEANLREVNSSKDKFFSIIAHDLRGPFNAIIGFSELLNSEFDEFNETEQKSMIRNIHEASLSTFKLLENLLEWSRIQTGRTKPNPDLVDLSTVVNSSLTFLKPQSEKKTIKVFSTIQFGTMAFCDENMITTVIRNLISNAIKFTNSGGEIRLSAIEKGKTVELSVVDNGIGIHPENIGKLFQIDESFKTGGTEGERGTGLGLLLCREFIELNDGKIWVTSVPGKGSKFCISLPVAHQPMRQEKDPL